MALHVSNRVTLEVKAGELDNGPQKPISANSYGTVVRTRTGGTKRAESARATKQWVTFQLPVIEKARDVVFFSPGLTMASLMEQALVPQLKRAQKR